MGYTNVPALNMDMADEFDRIAGGAEASPPYDFVLCPMTIFDTSSEPIRPVLSDLTIRCGGDGCQLDGGTSQVVFEDSTLDNYPIENITMTGISFTNFDGTSIAAYASDSTRATFESCAWAVSKPAQRFTNNMSVLFPS